MVIPILIQAPRPGRQELALEIQQASWFLQSRWKSEGVDGGVSKNWGTPKWMVYNGKPY